MTFGHTTPEKIIMIVTAVLAWLMMARTMRNKMNLRGWVTLGSCVTVFLYVMYVAVCNMPPEVFRGH